MADAWQQRRPRLAHPFTVLTEPGVVRLVAGEDYRYTLRAPGLEAWLPGLLEQLMGGHSIGELLAPLAAEQAAAAMAIIRQLYGERALVDGPAEAAHVGRGYRGIVEGQGPLVQRLRSVAPGDGPPLVVLCQDRLDFDAVVRRERECRAKQMPWLWVSHAALNRGYVGPLFLPDAGPCFVCLLRSFQRLSPAPELYDALLEHGRAGRPFQPADFPAEGLDIMAALVRCKLDAARQEQPPAALYRLHVLERDGMEVSTHRVFADPECPACGGGRG